MDFTDPGKSGFVVQPYTTNGPDFPTDVGPASTGVSAHTSLLFVGKGIPQYGEIVQENVLHLLENFAGTVPPSYAIKGQLWFNTTDSHLRVAVSDHTPGPVFDSNEWHVLISRDPDPLVNAADFGGSVLINAADPTNAQDVTTKNYVDTETAGILAAATSYANSTFLPLAGGNMTGGIYMAGGSEVTGLPATPSPTAAASKEYVDAQVLAAGSVTQLSHLTDVADALAPVLNDVLYFDGIEWSSVSPGVFGAASTLDDLTDVTLTTPADGELISFDFGTGQWTNALPATMGIVTQATNSVLAPSITISVDPTTVFSLDENLVSKAYVTQAIDAKAASFVVDSSIVDHKVAAYEGDITIEGDLGDLVPSTSFPDITTDVILAHYGKHLAYAKTGNERRIIVSGGVATLYNLYTGALPANDAFGISGTAYANNIQVFVNGIKQICSERGRLRIFNAAAAINSAAPNAIASFMPTGLNTASTYTASITVDGGAPIGLSISGAVAQTFAELIAEINLLIEPSAHARIDPRGFIEIISASQGTGSSISATDTDLFSSITAVDFEIVEISNVDSSFTINGNQTHRFRFGDDIVVQGTGGGSPTNNGTYTVGGVTYYPAENITRLGVTPTPPITDFATAGYQDIDLPLIGSPAVPVVGTDLVGLAVGLYDFDVNVDSLGAQLILVNIVGGETYDDLLADINGQLIGATAAIVSGDIRITSSSTGTLSSISITAGVGSPSVDLIAALSATVLSAVAGTDVAGTIAGPAYDLSDVTNSTSIAVDYSYKEFHGGSDAPAYSPVTQIEFTTAPVAGAIIEVITTNAMLNYVGG